MCQESRSVPDSTEGESFIVKNKWLWQSPQSFPNAPDDYLWKYTENLVDMAGLDPADPHGQGNSADMRSVFDNHWVVIVNGRLYDPSYG